MRRSVPFLTPLVPLVALALAPAVAGQGEGAATSDAEIVAALEELLEREAAGDRFSGAVLLAKGDEVLFEQAYGLASRRFDVPNRVDTKFNLGSMNKMFTGVAICQLAEAGKLSFEDRIIDHLPDYPNREVAEKVTIHQLLTHTSGLGSFWNDKFAATWAELRTVADHIPLFADDPLQFEPGSRFGYSNSGPVVLGRIIEAVTGETYYDYVREHVYAPAGMKDTDCYAMDEPVPNLAIGYTKVGADGHRSSDPDAPWRNNLFQHRVKGGPAGGGYSTVGDLFRFARALSAHELLSPEMTETLVTGKVDMGAGARYAYLFGDHTDGGHRYRGHNGGAPGINASLSFYPELGYTIAVLANVDRGAEPIAAFLRSMIERRPATVAGSTGARGLPPYRIGIGLALSSDDISVDFLVPGGPGEKAGLAPGDILLAINGEAVWADELLALLDARLQSPEPLKLRIRRGDEELDVSVTPEPRGGGATGSGPGGSWEMETEFGGQIVSALMVLEEKDGALRGTWHSMGAEMELRELRLEGNRLHFVRTMGPGGPAMTFEGAIDGDAIEGAFDFEGQELPCTGRRSK